jgi:UDP-galactopyranose mutase
LAAGKPVVSTPITDVMREYGSLKCVGIAHTTHSFIACCERALSLKGSKACLDEADKTLSRLSWDNTFAQMNALIEEAIKRRSMVPAAALIADSKRQEHELRTEP